MSIANSVLLDIARLGANLTVDGRTTANSLLLEIARICQHKGTKLTVLNGSGVANSVLIELATILGGNLTVAE